MAEQSKGDRSLGGGHRPQEQCAIWFRPDGRNVARVGDQIYRAQSRRELSRLARFMVNFESGKGPEMIMCTHEEIAVAIANGYARATGEIMATGLHNVVGLQHASMAIFNAWCDRTPILNLGGGGPQDTTQRRSTDWVHTAIGAGLGGARLCQVRRSADHRRRRGGIVS